LQLKSNLGKTNILGLTQRTIAVSAFTFLALLCVVPASAASISVTNASFELPPTATSCGGPAGCSFNTYAVGSSFTGWTVAGNSSDAGQLTEGTATFYSKNAVDSNTTVGYVANNGNTLYGPGYMYQVLGVTTLANTLYTLTVDVTQRTDIPAFSTASAIALKIGGIQTPVVTSASVTAGNWTTLTLNYISLTAGQTIEIDLMNTLARGTAGEAIFDNVTLSAVPEPSTIFMAGIGFAMLAIGARRKK